MIAGLTTGLNVLLGIITLGASTRFLFAKAFFSYHAHASGLDWVQVPPRLQPVILAILRVGGIGFLTVSLFIIAAGLSLYFRDDLFIRIGLAALTSLFWSGIFGITYGVYTRTKAKTPWLLSLLVATGSWVPLLIYCIAPLST